MFLVLVVVSPNYAQGIFYEKVRVREASSYDWEYAAEGIYSHRTATDERLKKYAATKQLYDLFGPRHAPSRPLPLILYVAPGNIPRWDYFEWTCRRQNVLFAAPRNAGNVQHPAIRCRATLDVLGDVQRRYRVDPNRTYIAGYSGGALIAQKLALAMPECFGGLMCMSQRLALHGGTATMVRAAERIDIVALCGGNELVGPEVEHVDVPVARASGFRAGSMVSRHLGHKRPAVNTIEAAYQWLEDGVDKRRELAKTYSSTCINWQRRFDQETWGQALLEELETLRDKEPQRAIAIVRWMMERWAETDLADEAATVVADIEPAAALAVEQSTAARQRKVETAMLEGYERAAQDRRASLSRERKAGFAKLALRYLDQATPRPADYSDRMAILQKVIAKAD